MDIKVVKQMIALAKRENLKKLHVKDQEVEISFEMKEDYSSSLPSEFPLEKNMQEIGDISLDDIIYSPMVGVAYIANSPEEKPFVELGGKVKKGDILCIIEAMKVMNEVKADKDGRIKEIKVKDGEVVEYGKQLFVIE